MKLTNIEGPTKGTCGQFKWVVQLELDKASPKGGYFVQEIVFKKKVDKKCPRNCSEVDKTYYEAWKVNAGKKVTTYAEGGDKKDDTYSVGSCPETEGHSSIKGKIRFFEDLTLPATFKANNPKTPQAGILLATDVKPKFWKAKCTLRHEAKSKWDCCDANTHDFSTVPNMTKKDKNPKPPGSGGKLFELLPNAKAWTDASGYGREDNQYMLEVAQTLLTVDTLSTKPKLQELMDEVSNYGSYYQDDLDELSKVYVLLRFLFDVPPSHDINDASVYGGWIRPDDADTEETYNLLWPVSVEDNQPQVTESFIGYLGAGYDFAGEFDYFAERFSLRNL